MDSPDQVACFQDKGDIGFQKRSRIPRMIPTESTRQSSEDFGFAPVDSENICIVSITRNRVFPAECHTA
jgi:hypothetical protein